MFILDISDTLGMLENMLIALEFISSFHFVFSEHWSHISFFQTKLKHLICDNIKRILGIGS